MDVSADDRFVDVRDGFTTMSDTSGDISLPAGQSDETSHIDIGDDRLDTVVSNIIRGCAKGLCNPC